MSINSGSNVVFIWFQNLATISSLLTWAVICLSYIKFYYAAQAQGVDRSTFSYKAPMQPYASYFGLFFFSLVVLFNGYYSFAPWNPQNFITSYITLPIFFGLFLVWKFSMKTKWVSSLEVDFRDRDRIDAMEWPERVPRNIVEKIWCWIVWCWRKHFMVNPPPVIRRDSFRKVNIIHSYC